MSAEPVTVLVLTDAESRLLRDYLTRQAMSRDPVHSQDIARDALTAYQRGIARGTERVKTEAKEKSRATR